MPNEKQALPEIFGEVVEHTTEDGQVILGDTLLDQDELDKSVEELEAKAKELKGQ